MGKVSATSGPITDSSSVIDRALEMIEYAGSSDCGGFDVDADPPNASPKPDEVADKLRQDLASGRVKLVEFSPEESDKLGGPAGATASGAADDDTIGLSSNLTDKLAKRGPGGELKNPADVDPTTLMGISQVLLHEYLHSWEMRNEKDCGDNGGNPDGAAELNGNPCDCYHAYVYARSLRMMAQYDCKSKAARADQDPGNDRELIQWEKSYDGAHTSWMRYRTSCEEQTRTNQPGEGQSGPYHPKSDQNPNGIPKTL